MCEKESRRRRVEGFNGELLYVPIYPASAERRRREEIDEEEEGSFQGEEEPDDEEPFFRSHKSQEQPFSEEHPFSSSSASNTASSMTSTSSASSTSSSSSDANLSKASLDWHGDTTDGPATLGGLAPPASCGFQGRRVLARHWEKCLNESRDGNSAASDWRSSQSFSMRTPAALVDLLRFLFLGRGGGDGIPPYTILYKKLVNHMVARMHLLTAKLEKVFSNEAIVSSVLQYDSNEAVRESWSRFTQMATDMLLISDIKVTHPLIEGIIELILHCSLAATTSSINLSSSTSHVGAGVQGSTCPIGFLCAFNDVQARGSTESSSELHPRMQRLIEYWSSTCRCQSHFAPMLSVTLSGLSATSPLAFIQPFSEQSKLGAVHQNWLVSRPDRLFIRLLFLALDCYIERVKFEDLETFHDIGLDLSQLAEAIGSCNSLYQMAKQHLIFLVRLAASGGPRDDHTLTHLASLMADSIIITTNRPPPIRSAFANEEPVPALESLRPTIREDLLELVHTILRSIASDTIPSNCVAADDVVQELRLQLGILCKRRGFLDIRAVDGPTTEALVAFADRLPHKNTLRTKCPPSFVVPSNSPARSGSKLSRPDISVITSFFVHRLLVLPMAAPSPGMGERKVSRFAYQLGLWDTFVLLSAPTMVGALVAATLGQYLVSYAASSLRTDVRVDSDILIMWILVAASAPLLLRQVPSKSMPACMAIQYAHDVLAAGKNAEEFPQSTPPTYQSSNCNLQRVRGSSNHLLSSLAHHVTFEKLFEFLHGRAEDQALTQALPSSWIRLLSHLKPTQGPTNPLAAVRDILNTIQEVYNIFAQTSESEQQRRQKARKLLGALHNRFEELAAACREPEYVAANAAAYSEVDLEGNSVRKRIALKACRMILFGLFDWVVDDICNTPSNPVGGSGISADFDAGSSAGPGGGLCQGVLLSFLLTEFRSDRFVDRFADWLPARVLDGLKRLCGTADGRETLVPLCSTTLPELLLRWIANLCKADSPWSFRKAVLLQRLLQEISPCGDCLFCLRTEDRSKLEQFLAKRRQVAVANNQSRTHRLLLLLQYGSLREGFASTDGPTAGEGGRFTAGEGGRSVALTRFFDEFKSAGSAA